MMGWLIRLVLFGAFILFMLIVPLGSRTLWGHIANIWEAEQTQELVDGVVESSGPLVDKIKRGVEAGTAELQKDGVAAPSESANLLQPNEQVLPDTGTTPVDPTELLE